MAESEEKVAEFWSFPTNPAEFDADDRISFAKLDNKFVAVQEDGAEYEFDGGLKRWIPIIDEALIESHQAAYGGPAADSGDGQDKNGRKKRKHNDDAADGNGIGNGNGKQRGNKRQAVGAQPPRQNTAIYVTGLPLDATLEEVAELFSRKCGVIAEEIDGNRPRIKMYTNEQGQFKGDALVVFFKPQSVDMAIMLLDDTDFRLFTTGASTGRIRVQAADASYKKTNYDQDEATSGAGSKPSSGSSSTNHDRNSKPATSSSAAAAGGGAQGGNKPTQTQRSAADKQKIIKKTQKLNAKLEDWDDDDPHPAAALLPPPPPDRKGGERLVILKHMFTLEELEEDPAALLEIKEDVREECEKLGEVTNVVLFDLEEDGVISVKFRKPEAAEACIQLMDGRSFAGQVVEARLTTGKEKFRKSKSKDEEEDDD